MSTSGAGNVDLKLEAVVIPVSDVDRSKEFYVSLGWRLDADFPFDNGFRVVQLTPPGSGCSVQFGSRMTSAAPGSAQGLYLIVSDIDAARDDLDAHGANPTEVFHTEAPGAQFEVEPSGRVSGPAPGHRSYSSFVTFSDPDSNTWLLQEITTRLPGRIDAAETAFVDPRPCQRGSVCRGRPRRARDARRRATRRELARLVCRVHGGGASRRRPAHVTRSVRSPADLWLASVSSCHTFGPGSRELAFLHVSAPLRATGIGSRLSEQLEQIARTAGDSDMVVSATPSENTVRFYLGRGFQPMAEPLAELFELEPEDVHLRKLL